MPKHLTLRGHNGGLHTARYYSGNCESYTIDWRGGFDFLVKLLATMYRGSGAVRVATPERHTIYRHS